MHTLLLTVVLVSLVGICAGAGGEWPYPSGAGWASKGVCGSGQRQSPIDTPATVGADLEVDASLGEFHYEGYDKPDEGQWTVVNRGTTLQVNVGKKNLVSEGGLPDVYQLLQFHMHWGSDDSQGSEHTIAGKKYPLEIHFVHIKKEFDGNVAHVLENAISDGGAVLGVMFEIAPRDNPVMDEILRHVADIKYNGKEATMRPFPLGKLLPRYTEYYRYMGGLTTPTCDEVIVWTLFSRPLPISSSQMATLRSLMYNNEGEADGAMVDNYRLPQPLNGRVVKLSKGVISNSATSLSISSAVAFILSALSLFVIYH